jgi:hypothetical protein
VQLPERLNGQLHELGGLVPVRDVVTAGDRLPAVGADRLGYDFGRALVVSAAVDIPAAVVDYDGSTLGREVARVGAAQAASGTRDYRNTA